MISPQSAWPWNSQNAKEISRQSEQLLKELQDIGVEEPELAATVQHIMLVEWSVFHAVRMFEYHDIERVLRPIVELVKIMARCRDESS